MKIIDIVSICCNAPVRVPAPLPDFIGGQGITMCYICTKCNNACDVKEVKSNGKQKN